MAGNRAVAAMVAQRGRPEQAATPEAAPKPRRRVRATTGGGPASVQRAIGFEFETGWLLKAPANTIGMHTAVVQGTGWKVVPDRVEYSAEELEAMGIGMGRTHVGSGSMEFVTDAFDEAAVGPGGALDDAMRQIERAGQALAAAPRGFFGGQLDAPLRAVIGGNIMWGPHLALPANTRPGDAAFEAALNRRENLLVRRIGELAAAPQMTAGIKLEQVLHLLDRISSGGAVTPPGQAAPASALMAQSDPVEVQIVANCVDRARQIAAARVAHHVLAPAQRETYAGMLAELGSYIRLARAYGNNIAYDKGIAPLLSRTDFGQLPAWVSAVASFVDDAMLASNRYGGAATADMVGHGNDDLFVKPGLHDGLSVRQWLGAIAAGRDPLTWGQDRTKVAWNPQQVGQVPHQALGHVYELRRMVNPLPFNQWRQYALDMASLVVLANQGNLQ